MQRASEMFHSALTVFSELLAVTQSLSLCLFVCVCVCLSFERLCLIVCPMVTTLATDLRCI